MVLDLHDVGQVGDDDADQHGRQEARQKDALGEEEAVDRVAQGDADRQHQDRRQLARLDAVLADQVARNRPAQDAAADQPKGGEGDADHAGAGEARGLGFGAPGDGGAVAAGEGDAAGHQAVARMGAQAEGDRHARGVLQDQEHGGDRDQDRERLAAGYQGAQLGREADGAEEDQQQDIANLHVEVDLEIPPVTAGGM
jgi:hypothetical protein